MTARSTDEIEVEFENMKPPTPEAVQLDPEVEEVLKEVDFGFRDTIRGMVARNPTPLREAKRLVKFYQNPGTTLVNPAKPRSGDFKVLVPNTNAIKAEAEIRRLSADPAVEKARQKAELGRVNTLNARAVADLAVGDRQTAELVNKDLNKDLNEHMGAPVLEVALYLATLARVGLKPNSTPGLYLVEIPGDFKDIKAWQLTKAVTGKGFWSKVRAAFSVAVLAIKMVFQRG